MRIYVGVTDTDWFNWLSSARPDEVNFWKPGEGGHAPRLEPGELFLFKLHAPRNFIVGGGHFVKFSKLPVSLVWRAFGEKNGVGSIDEFLTRIRKYRRGIAGPDPSIGNIVLSDPFWFTPADWIPQPENWPMYTVSGKGYDTSDWQGHELLAAVRARLGSPIAFDALTDERTRFDRAEVNVRLGQGGFRVSVVDAYGRRCAITGESTLPVLEASHIRPYAREGPHEVRNGLLLRSDMHTLFDAGYLTVTPDLRLEVSSQIREQFVNGKLYYSYHGQELRSVPDAPRHQPGRDFLMWHNEHKFMP